MTPERHAVHRHVLSGLFCFLAVAAPAASTSTDWSSRAWQINDGLPNNFVVGTARTPDGFLWVCTRKGIVRFDGVEFEEFSLEEFIEGRADGPRVMTGTRDGALWMAMDHGLTICWSAGTAHVITNGLPNMTPENVTEDADGSVWIAFKGGAVFRIKDGKAAEIGEIDGLPGGGGSCLLALDVKGRLWFAKGRVIGVRRDGRFQTFLPLNAPATGLCASRAGGVWIVAGLKLGHCEEDGAFREERSLESGQTGSMRFVLCEDRQGAVWIGGDNGLDRYDGAGLERMRTSDRQISSLMEDRKGDIWVGTVGGGLNRIRPRVVSLENADSDPSFDGIVHSLCEDSAGVLWAATRNGQLVRRAGGRWSDVLPAPNWPAGIVTCVAADKAGGLWIGTKQQELHCLRNGQLSSWSRKDGITGRRVNTLVVGKSGRVWIGGELPDAVDWLENGKVGHVPLPGHLRGIRTMAEDPAGNIWITAGRGGGGHSILRVEGDHLVDESKQAFAPSKYVRCVATTSDGAIWFGCAGPLVRLKDGRFSHITTDQGFFDTVISQMVADDCGWMWFGGDHGLFKIRLSELNNVADGMAARVLPVCYLEDGFSHLQGNNGISPGGTRTSDGRVWLPMRTALAIIDPRKSREDLEPPPVVVTRVAMDDQIVAQYGGAAPMPDAKDLRKVGVRLRLPPRHLRLEFGFGELSFGSPENVYFQVRLDGYDKEWREISGTVRSVDYSRLPAGDYTFRVKARSDGGVWTKTGAAVAFTVAPFVWQTWWFRLATLAGFTAIVVGVSRYVSLQRLRRRVLALEHQAALDKERARIARDLHDEFGSRLTELGLIAELERRGTPSGRVKQNGSELIENIRSLHHDLDTMVWSVNPKNDSLDHLAGFICQFAGEFFSRCGIRCRLDVPDSLPAIPLTPEIRHHLFLMVREAANNVLKHSSATIVKLRIAFEKDTLHFSLEDDGRGFVVADAEAGERNGLKNMRARIGEAGGEFAVQSEPGKGTTVRFSVVLKREVRPPRSPGE